MIVGEFVDALFPIRISFHAEGGPAWTTSVSKVASGVEYRDQTAQQDLGLWTVSRDAILPPDDQLMIAFVRVIRGKLNGFLFKDWTDFQITSAQGVLTATGDFNQYQMYKRYSVDTVYGDSPSTIRADRIIKKPEPGTATINGGSGVSVDYRTGLVTSTTPPTSFSSQFYVPVRFDLDHMPAQIIDRAGGSALITGWQSIALAEIRIP